MRSNIQTIANLGSTRSSFGTLSVAGLGIALCFWLGFLLTTALNTLGNQAGVFVSDVAHEFVHIISNDVVRCHDGVKSYELVLGTVQPIWLSPAERTPLSRSDICSAMDLRAFAAPIWQTDMPCRSIR